MIVEVNHGQTGAHDRMYGAPFLGDFVTAGVRSQLRNGLAIAVESKRYSWHDSAR